MSAQKFQPGDRCNWVGQKERLIYMGIGTGGSRGWHQFALVQKPGVVWCEVLPEDLGSIELTKQASAVQQEPVLVSIEMHNRLSAGPNLWSSTRIPSDAFHAASAAYGSSDLMDEQRLYRALQAAFWKAYSQQAKPQPTGWPWPEFAVHEAAPPDLQALAAAAGFFLTPVEQGGKEAVIVDGGTYCVHPAVAAELLRLHIELKQASVAQQPVGWLYDWTHSSALGKPDEHFTSFTPDEEHASKHSNPRPVFSTVPQAKPPEDHFPDAGEKIGEKVDTDVLMRFYGVNNLVSLIVAQATHIEKLQAKLPGNDQPSFIRVREG